MLPEPLKEAIIKYIEAAADPVDALNDVRAVLHDLSPVKGMPVDFVRWVPIEEVESSDYNPNAVARQEMGLLLRSIRHDGYTQPVVVIRDEEKGRFIIVDGFHRYFIAKTVEEIQARTGGRLPVVVIDKSVNERMAATVRHNRARGKHSIKGMGNLVFEMLKNGMADADVCNEIGLEAEELLKLKHITGYSKLYRDHGYNNAWVSKNQIQVAREQGVDLTSGV